MTRYVALLRGVNLGKAHRVAMADLRAVFEGAGCGEVATYIQSGNVVFDHGVTDHGVIDGGNTELGRLVGVLEARMAEAFGFEIPTLIRTQAEWKVLFAANPYVGAEGNKVHVVFLRQPPSERVVASIDRDSFGPDEFTIVGREAFMHLPEGMARSRLPGALDRLGAPLTVRNWRTVSKLADMLGDGER